MLENLSHLPVNWMDGMKISRRHFVEMEYFIHEQVRDSNAQQLTDFNYGILPADRSLDLTVFCDFNLQVNVELNACKAITPNGSRIYIDTPGYIKLNTNFKEIASRFGLQSSLKQQLFIILSINPFSRIPAGEPLLEEDPPRHPSTQGEVKLDIIPAGQINDALLRTGIIIGMISYNNGELIFERDYIPACSSIGSLPVLLDWYNKFRQKLEKWGQYSLEIARKTNQKDYKEITLLNGVNKLAEKMLEKLADQKLHYQWIVGKSAPVFMCEQLLRNVQYVLTIMDCFDSKDSKTLYDYFSSEAGLTSNILETQLLKAVQIHYNHNNIVAALIEIESVYNTLLNLFEKLVRIEPGKKGLPDIFINQQPVRNQDVFITSREPKTPPPPDKPQRWSPI